MALLYKRCNAIVKHLIDGLELESQTPQLGGVELVVRSVLLLKPEKSNQNDIQIYNPNLYFCVNSDTFSNNIVRICKPFRERQRRISCFQQGS